MPTRKRARNYTPTVSGGGGGPPTEDSPEIDIIHTQGTITIDDQTMLMDWNDQQQGTVTIDDQALIVTWNDQDQGSLTISDQDPIQSGTITHQQGTLTLDDDSVLRVDPFIQTQGTLTLTDDTTLRVNPFIQSQGTVTISDQSPIQTGSITHQQGTLTVDDLALKVNPFVQAQGTVTIDESTTLALMFAYGVTETVVSGTWTNAGAAQDRPNVTGRVSSGGNTTPQTLRVQGAPVAATGWTMLPETAIIGASWACDQQVGVGQDVNVRCSVNGGTFHAHVNGSSAATERRSASFLAELDPVSNNDNIQTDLDALGGDLLDLFRDTVIEFDQDKAALGNSGNMTVDAILYMTFAYQGTAPTVEAIHDFTGADWTDNGNLGSSNFRLQNLSAVAAAEGVYNVATFRDFDLLVRFGGSRPIAGTNTIRLGFWLDNDSDIGLQPQFRFIIGTSTANDDLIISDDVDDHSFSPSGWRPATATSPAQMGNMLWIQVRDRSNDQSDTHIRVYYLDDPSDPFGLILVDQAFDFGGTAQLVPGHIGIGFDQASAQNEWVDDIIIIGG